MTLPGDRTTKPRPGNETHNPKTGIVFAEASLETPVHGSVHTSRLAPAAARTSALRLRARLRARQGGASGGASAARTSRRSPRRAPRPLRGGAAAAAWPPRERQTKVRRPPHGQRLVSRGWLPVYGLWSACHEARRRARARAGVGASDTHRHVRLIRVAGTRRVSVQARSAPFLRASRSSRRQQQPSRRQYGARGARAARGARRVAAARGAPARVRRGALIRLRGARRARRRPHATLCEQWACNTPRRRHRGSRRVGGRRRGVKVCCARCTGACLRLFPPRSPRARRMRSQSRTGVTHDGPHRHHGRVRAVDVQQRGRRVRPKRGSWVQRAFRRRGLFRRIGRALCVCF